MNTLQKLTLGKTFSFLFLSLFATAALSNVEVPEGEYTLSNFKVTQVKVQKYILMSTPDAQDKVRDFKNKGFECFRVRSGLTECRQYIVGELTNEEINRVVCKL